MTAALDLETFGLPTAILKICSEKVRPRQNETLHIVKLYLANNPLNITPFNQCFNKHTFFPRIHNINQ